MRRRVVAALVGVLAVVGTVVGISIVWPGLDARETPTVDVGLWVLQSGDGRRYARVNTAVGELDTVRSVGNPSAVAQSADGAFLFSESFGKVTRIDEALPPDIDAAVLDASPSTPGGTVEVRTAGPYVVYRTDTGAVWAGRLGADPAPVDPDPGSPEDAAHYAAEAVALAEDGVVYAYSRVDASVLRWDIATSRVLGRDDLALDDDVAPQVTGVGERWLVLDPASGRVWRDEEPDPVTVPVAGTALLAHGAPAGEAFFMADEAGLVRIPFDGDQVRRAFGAEGQVQGTPARPTWFDGDLLAAWLPRSGSGVLWSSGDVEPVALDYGGLELGDQRRPAFMLGSGAAVLNDMRSGWVWQAPDGELIPSSQAWAPDETESPGEQSEQTAPVVIDPRPPVAVPDAFGVRAGSLTALPVLLNDHDPNTDVLTIDPASVSGLDPAFGTVSLTDNRQSLAVRVADGAAGSATFTYRVTDGTSETGLYSEPTTVTLSVADGNDAPQWCGVDGCLAEWPQPEVARGGTVSVPLLSGWVDPEGDPLLLLGVENPSGVGAAVATPAGEVIYQHSDDGTTGDARVDLHVTVADTRGATSTRTLTVAVRAEAALKASSFSVVDILGAAIGVDVEPHVTGTAGHAALTAVRVLDDAPATATISAGTTVFDFAPREVGTYRVGYTVGEGATAATAIAQITVLPPDAPAELATAPVVAFVHPREDVTVDVFGAVTNPTRRVLLLSDVEFVAEPGASLWVDAVAQRYLRVTGSTADGAPGRLGTVRYVVSDGTADAGARVTGEATVYLLPPAPEAPPVAVDDAIEVRSGTQVDIPVLRNDAAPSGASVTLNPALVRSSTPDALAFASGGVIRYLAPDEPGDYTVEYTVYTAGSPSLADAATVRVRVTDEEANRAPTPHTLEGRVLAGQSTMIPFDAFGVDPDGDAVFLDRIITQPEAGTASLTADGTGIVYTSVVGAGGVGQQVIRYGVIDALGAVGEGTVRVGVLGAEADPSPVTFTDYVQLQAGTDSELRVEPLANDIDPFEGQLTLTDVRPDVAPTLADGSANPEHERQEAMVTAVDGSSFTIRAGTVPGTVGFLYDVRSDSGNTARGMVVVKIVREAVPNYPTVVDTLLTAETRELFATGVDVVAGKVTWSGGADESLRVDLWRDVDDVAVDGHRLSGELSERARVIPFAVTAGEDADVVTTYAFLRVPGEAAPLVLRAGARPQQVDEGAAVEFDMADLVAAGRGATLEVGDGLSASGSRAQSECTADGTVIRYSAGLGAPWTDACHVPVRLLGASEWTLLSVPIRVRPIEPQPILLSGAQTVAPGESITFDLRDLVRWQGRADDAALAFAVAYTGARFRIAQDGPLVSVTGVDTATPGAEDVATITVISHADVPAARLNLRVGPSPSTLPQGGSTTQVCSQADGSSCVIPVIGAAGEINPLPGTPLQVTDVRATGSCAGIAFEPAGQGAVLATWTADAAGTTCAATFTVRDAQGRTTAGDRDGRILLDLQGFPRAPASIVQTAYGDGWLTLRVDPGEARAAYPALTGFVVRHGGVVVAQCTPDGACPTIAAPNGEERVYEASALNAVGPSRTTVRTSAWAYDVPASPSRIEVAPVVTGGAGGVIAVHVAGIDDVETGEIEISSPVGETLRVPVMPGQTEVRVSSFTVGSNELTPVTITPHSRYPLPPGLGGAQSGAAVTVPAHGVGAPVNPALTLTSTPLPGGSARIDAVGTASPGGHAATVRLGIAPAGQTCVPDGETAAVSASYTVPNGIEYRYTLCAQSWYDGRVFGTVTTDASVRALQPTTAPSGHTFAVDARPDIGQGGAAWRVRNLPVSTEPVPRGNVVDVEPVSSDVFDRDPGIRVRYRHAEWGTASEWAQVSPRAGSAPYQVWATWGVQTCVGGAALGLRWDSSQDPAGARAAVAFSDAAVVYYDAAGAPLAHEPGSWTVPVGAVRVTGVAVTVDWEGRGWGLNPAQAQFGGACDPNLTPPVEGAPEPPDPPALPDMTALPDANEVARR